jgi:hypothetical protein
MLRRALALGGLYFFAACASPPGSSTANVKDSFVNPTAHGELRFAAVNQASFDEEHRFHAWTFELGDGATLDLRTELYTTNLDTVAYLFHRSSAAEAWGEYVAKNDDHDGERYSRIEGEFPAGEYKLVVKAIKTTHYGDFSVVPACDGAGCPATDACAAEPPLPAPGGFTASCAERYHRLMLDDVFWPKEDEVAYSSRCNMGPVGARAMAYFKQYYQNSWSDWEAASDGDPRLYVKVYDDDAGATVVVDSPMSDEDQLTFLFDDQGDLFAVQRADQSSSVNWYCGDNGEPELTAPDPDCVAAGIRSLLHGEDEVTGGDESFYAGELEAIDDMPWAVTWAATRFVQDASLADDDLIEVYYQAWESLDYDGGALVELSSGGTNYAYAIADGEWHSEIITRTGDDGTVFICE